MEFCDERLWLVVERDELKKRINKLESNIGLLPYADVIELKNLKKRNLQIKDILTGH